MTLLEDARIAGVGVVETFGSAIQHATINRSIDNAPMVTLTLLDPDLEIINSALVAGLSDDDDVIIERANPRLDMPPVMSLDGNQWVLVKADKQDSRVVELGFVLFEVYLLTVTNGYRKAFRNKVDRLAFCESMCRESRVKFHAPEAGPPTPTFAGSSEVPGSTPASGASSGFEGGVTIYVNSAPASADAKDALSTSMQYAIGLGVSEDVMIGMVMAGTGESRWYRKATNHVGAGHYGIFQQDPRYYTRPDAYDIVQATHEFLVGGKTWDREKNSPTTTTPQPGSFIKLMQGFTGQASTIGDIITRRQGSDAAGSYYQAYYAESKRTVAAYQSPDRKRSHTVLLAHDKYEFTRGQPGNPESTWTCLSRLASEIGWRRFMVSDTVWFVADEWLFATPAVDTLAEASGAVNGVTWSWDLGKPLNECSITVDDSWIRSPGVVFKVEGQGPATGKWLLAEWERDLLRPTGTLRLVKPGQTIPEPVGDQSGKGWKRKLPDQSFDPGATPTGTDVGSKVAAWALSYAPTPPPAYQWGAKHGVPFAAILANPHPAPPFDCSSFSRWAWGGVAKIDIAVPSGDTTYGQIKNARENPLVQHGEAGTTPPGGFKPGDLVYTHDGGHVSIIVGPNDTVSAEQTSTGIQRRTLDWHGAVFFWARWSAVTATP